MHEGLQIGAGGSRIVGTKTVSVAVPQPPHASRPREAQGPVQLLIYPGCYSPGMEQQPDRGRSRMWHGYDRGRRDGYRVDGTITGK